MSTENCFVLGSGFSVPAGLPIQQNLMCDISRDDAKVFQCIFGISPTDPNIKNIYLEDAFTFLDQIILNNEIADTIDSNYAVKAKNVLIEHIIKQFNKKQKLLKHQEEYFYFFDSIVKRKINGETNPIISINWDTLPEFYIHQAFKKRNVKGDIDYACFDWDWDEKEDFTPSLWRKAKGETTIKVLKLHGSINWFYNKRNGSLRVKEQKAAYPEGLIPEGDDKENYEYVFITPTLLKNINNTHLKMVWMNVGYDLMDANRIVFLGCSFLLADHDYKYLLMKYVLRRKNVKIRVLLYPKDPKKDEIKRRFKNFFIKSDIDFKEMDVKDFITDKDLVWNW